MNKKTIALCGVPTKIAQAMDRCSEYYILPFSDEPERRGDVKLAYFIKDGAAIDLAVVGYPGAVGLTACDYLRAQSRIMPILWLCDRVEFEPEAQRMDVGFYSIVLPEAERTIQIEQIEQTVQTKYVQTVPTQQTLSAEQTTQTLQAIETEKTVQIILNAVNMKAHEGS